MPIRKLQYALKLSSVMEKILVDRQTVDLRQRIVTTTTTMYPDENGNRCGVHAMISMLRTRWNAAPYSSTATRPNGFRSTRTTVDHCCLDECRHIVTIKNTHKMDKSVKIYYGMTNTQYG